jgi:hypothetical protein
LGNASQGLLDFSQLVAFSPQFTFASLESHKAGGIVRLPREIDEQSIVPLGQFLARYGAIEFARLEDRWGFLSDVKSRRDDPIIARGKRGTSAAPGTVPKRKTPLPVRRGEGQG